MLPPCPVWLCLVIVRASRLHYVDKEYSQRNGTCKCGEGRLKLVHCTRLGWNVPVDLSAIVMRPSSVGGGRILRRTLSVCLSVCLSVRPVIVYITTVLRANIQNRKTSVFAYGPASRMYFSARAEGRISYGHLGRTNLLRLIPLRFNGHFPGGPGLADTRMSPFWILLELRTTWLVLTAGDIRCAKPLRIGKAPIESSPPTNQHPTFYRLDALPVTQPCPSTEGRRC